MSEPRSAPAIIAERNLAFAERTVRALLANRPVPLPMRGPNGILAGIQRARVEPRQLNALLREYERQAKDAKRRGDELNDEALVRNTAGPTTIMGAWADELAGHECIGTVRQWRAYRAR